MDSFVFDPFDRTQTHAVAETAQKLLREEPVLRLANGFVVVSRYDDAKQVITNTKVFANSGGFRPTGLKVPLEDRSLGEIDPPVGERGRGAVGDRAGLRAGSRYPVRHGVQRTGRRISR